MSTTSDDFDVLVLGGGIAGVSVLAQVAPHARVALVEAEPALTYHTTGRSAAMYAPGYGGPAVEPLTAASEAFLFDPPAVFGGPLALSRPILHLAGPGQLDALLAQSRERARDRKLRWISPQEAVAQAPILRASRITAGLLDERGADLDVARLHEGFLKQARAAGAAVFMGAGQPNLYRVDGAWRIVAHELDLRARVVVNATGAWADATARQAGVRTLSLRALSRTVVLVEPPALPSFEAWPTVIDAEERYYFRPFSGRLLVTSANETPSRPCDASPDEMQAALALHRFDEACDHKVERIVRKWAGLRTFAPDRAPVIGWSANAPDFFWHAGLGGFGIQTAPAASRLAASLILGAPLPADLAAHGVDPQRYAPGRDPARRPLQLV
ncbi:MAG: FAD-binding oxidoreductase [Phenylobacterium sp.]|uniref:NAD(P)/FAD-dependent oxidoreductase n=1 Tax=Phenylobacterium sp. TaxID=1871053 RepID=UPI002A35B764|nr:FAD-binding oxidoreductase [Phenylobacterium sp.]MDX9997815.1 FAD-binding oxidoreductase [Phenylobacterium sp.]